MRRTKGFNRGRTMNKGKRQHVRFLSCEGMRPNIKVGNSAKLTPFIEIIMVEKYGTIHFV